jgi:hypothetical protein
MLNKALLPSPRSFYEQELGRLSRPDRKGWAKANCPFHESKSHTSLNVNVDHGGFICWGCDAKGGDVIAFLRLRHGLSFRQACASLNCWTDRAGITEADKRELARSAKEQERRKALAEQMDAEIHSIRMNTRDTIHALHKARRDSTPEGAWSGDLEWELRLEEGRYDLLSFADRPQQVQYLALQVEERDSFIFDCLAEGRI